MAQYKLTCPKCGETARKLLKPEVFKAGVPCPKCQTHMERSGNVTSAKMEKLDNGVMTRSIERIADVEEAMRERGKLGTLKKWTHDR
jgi:uncharacterized Zn finger protein